MTSNTPLLLISILVAYLLVAPCSSFSTASTAATSATIRTAVLPDDLSAIQECRRSAHPGKDVSTLLSAAQSFCNADQIQKDGYVCIIAQAKDGMVLGTADLNTRTKVVNNVYVREEARKQGLAQLMMEKVEESLDKPTTLKLTVMSKNIPAISLYKKLGFEAPGVYGFLDATPFDFLIEMEKKLS